MVQPELYEVDESESYLESYPDKRKRLSIQDSQPRSQVVDIVAWGFVGTIGLMMTIGSTIIATQTNSPAIMIIPFLYMVIVMGTMRRR
ncbi:MAG: hypothetical protein K8I82_27760 [Anaerolineae bacterium]|nr:hypothetical protein [Anaerolineae bacterium]